MQVNVTLRGLDLADFAPEAARAQALGFDGAYVTETNNDPFLPLALAAQQTQTIALGTSVALAFPRSPMHVAHTAWDLQRLTHGRLVLGLGTQVRAHVERRFSATWSEPAARMGEYVQALRAIWAAWQDGSPLNFEGRFYRHTLMPPNFRPRPLPEGVGAPAVHVAAVRERMLEIAAEHADGIMLHAFLTPEHLRGVVLPAIDRGLQRGGRAREQLHVGYGVFVAADEAEWEAARRRVAFYGSTPGYRGVFETHGLGALADRLHSASRTGDWAAMAGQVGDQVLDLFCVRAADPVVAAAQIRERVGGLVDSIGFNAGLDADQGALAPIAAALRA